MSWALSLALAQEGSTTGAEGPASNASTSCHVTAHGTAAPDSSELCRSLSRLVASSAILLCSGDAWKVKPSV